MVLVSFTKRLFLFCAIVIGGGLFNALAADIPQTIEPSVLSGVKALNAENASQVQEAGKDKLIYFWATWCPDCKDKLTSVFKNDELYKKFDVILVATDKDKEKIEHFTKKNTIKPFVVTDEDRNLQKALSVFSVPTFVRLKKSGEKYQVLHKQSGGEIEKFIKE